MRAQSHVLPSALKMALKGVYALRIENQGRNLLYVLVCQKWPITIEPSA